MTNFQFQISNILLSNQFPSFSREVLLSLFLLLLLRLMNVVSICYSFFTGSLSILVFLKSLVKMDYRPSLILMMDLLILGYQLRISLYGFKVRLEEAWNFFLFLLFSRSFYPFSFFRQRYLVKIMAMCQYEDRHRLEFNFLYDYKILNCLFYLFCFYLNLTER